LGKGLAAGAEPIGTAVQGVGHDLAKGVVGAEALEDEIPQRNQWGKGPVVETARAASEPGTELTVDKETAKRPEELGGAQARALEQRGALGGEGGLYALGGGRRGRS